jgi:hypothetical protein
MRTPLTYQQAGGGHTVAVPVCRRCGGSQRLHSGGTGALSRQRCARPASSGWRPVRRALGFPSEKMWKSSSVSPPTHTAARNQAGLAARPPGHPGEGSARRVGPGSRQAALKSGVTAPQVAWALPSRAGDPRTAPRAPYGRFLINSRDSPERGQVGNRGSRRVVVLLGASASDPGWGVPALAIDDPTPRRRSYNLWRDNGGHYTPGGAHGRPARPPRVVNREVAVAAARSLPGRQPGAVLPSRRQTRAGTSPTGAGRGGHLPGLSRCRGLPCPCVGGTGAPRGRGWALGERTRGHPDRVSERSGPRLVVLPGGLRPRSMGRKISVRRNRPTCHGLERGRG